MGHVATQQPSLNPVDYAIWGPSNSVCTMVESLRTWNS